MTSAVKVPTGIAGLDQILGGGFPKGRVILLAGGPGTGKTVACTQFLVNGIEKFGENGVFVSLDETKFHYYREMNLFKLDLRRLENEKKFVFLDASPIRHMPGEVKVGKFTLGKREFSIASIVESLRNHVEAIEARRVAIDPVTSLIFQYPDVAARRSAMLDLIDALVGLGVTCVLTMELKTPGPHRAVQFEEYLAHGVIILQTLKIGSSMVRVLSVEKMREVAVDLQPKLYRISDKGVEVFPTDSVLV